MTTGINSRNKQTNKKILSVFVYCIFHDERFTLDPLRLTLDPLVTRSAFMYFLLTLVVPQSNKTDISSLRWISILHDTS